MTVHRYPLHALRGDLAGAALGAAGTLALLLAAQPGWFGGLILGGLALLFLGFLCRTLVQAGRTVRLAPDALRMAGPLDLPIFRRTIPWTCIRRVGLRYFATRRDRAGGWLELTVAGPDATISLESGIEGFETILARVAAAARANGAAMNEDTAENLSALGALPRWAAGEGA